VNDLAVRLAALDPEAGAALQVIAYFDRLVEGRAGLQPIVRGAAVLTGSPARLVDEGRHVHVRVDPDGRAGTVDGPPDAAWLSTPVDAAGSAVLWIERAGPPSTVDAMVLERAAAAARAVLDRTRGRAQSVVGDPASTEVLLDPEAPVEARQAAARRLGLPLAGLARAIALPGGVASVEAVAADGGAAVQRAAGRVGVGPSVPVLALPGSWSAARTALRLTAAGTEDDPGPTVVHADELGGLALLAAVVDPADPPVPDVVALGRAAAAAPWMLSTLDAVVANVSLRTAAAALRVHHSTLQDRVVHAEHLLGWSVREPAGRLRLHLALALRRLHRPPV
jgi:hypothetical protein